MIEINIKEKYHEDIVEIWKMGKNIPVLKAIYEKGAFLQDTIYKDSILFVGIGASWDESKKETCIECDRIQYETKDGRNHYPYYKKMIEIAKETDFENWSHIDMTLLRETSQNVLKPFFKNPSCIDFLQAQFDLAYKMICDIKPKIMLVNNAFVRDLLKQEDKSQQIKSKFKFEFNDVIGTDVITEPVELKDTPVFFTSMLHGSGALDNGSYERLKWHIKFVKIKPLV